MILDCKAIRESLAGYLQSETDVISGKNYCLLSLPLKVLDGAYAEVFIEERGADSFLIHDGGKTLNHLESSGVLLSESRIATLSDLAVRLGVILSTQDRSFKMIAKANTINSAAISIGQCCSIALYQLLTHIPSSEEERIRSRVRRMVRDWSTRRGINIKEDRKYSGAVRQYKLDFVAESKPPVAISILIPTYGATVSADRYGLQILDLGTRPQFDNWKTLAVLAKPQRWREQPRKIVAKLATRTTDLPDSDLPMAEELRLNEIGDTLDQLIA